MRWTRWGIGALAAVAVAGAVAVAVPRLGTAQADDTEPGRVARYQELLAKNLGVSVDDLKAAEKAARDQLIDEQVAAGKLTAEKAAKLKEMPPGQLLRGALAHGRGHRVRAVIGNILDAAANVIHISRDVLVQELQQGKTIAQVASERGVSRDALKQGIVTAEKAKLNQAVANGKLTQAQADKLLQGLTNRVDKIIDRTRAGGPRS